MDYALGDARLAEDLAQDAFIAQYASWARLSHYDNPGAWVRKVALRIAFRARKRLLRAEPLKQASDLQSADVDPVKVLDVRNAVLQLPDAQRAAIVLHYYRDLPVVEVAHALGVKRQRRNSILSIEMHKALL